MMTGSRQYVLNSSNFITILLTVVYKSCDHRSVHISPNSPLWVFPHSSHVYCCLSPCKHSFWGLAEQGCSGFQLIWVILRAFSASAEDCKWNLWSGRNEAQSRGSSLKGRGNPTKLDLCHLIIISILNCIWKQKMSWYKWWKGMAEHFSQNCISACLKCKAEELFIDTSEARAKREWEI